MTNLLDTLNITMNIQSVTIPACALLSVYLRHEEPWSVKEEVCDSDETLLILELNNQSNDNTPFHAPEAMCWLAEIVYALEAMCWLVGIVYGCLWLFIFFCFPFVDKGQWTEDWGQCTEDCVLRIVYWGLSPRTVYWGLRTEVWVFYS